MDTVPEASNQAFTDSPQTWSSGRLRKRRSSDSGYSSDPTFLCISNNISTVVRAPDVTSKGFERTSSNRSHASNDSGYHSDNTARKASCLSGLSINSRDYILALADPRRFTVAETQSSRVQKQPATFQCNLCPKRFTRAYNLRSHSRTHTDKRPFVCTICGKAFARHHDRKRHEGLHSGEKKFVCGRELRSQPSLHWGCSRRFARADALGRHLRSEAGRNCIKPLLYEEARESFIKQQEDISAAGFCTKIDADAERVGAFMIPAALLLQYPALQNIDCSQIRLGEDVEEDYSLGRSSFDSGYESSPFALLPEPTHPSRMRMDADVGGLESSLKHLCSNGPDELCKNKTKNSPVDFQPACEHLSSPKPSLDSSTALNETGESEATPTSQSRVASTDLEIFGTSSGTEVLDYLDRIVEERAELCAKKRKSTYPDDIAKLIENPNTDDAKNTEDAAKSNANFHDSSVLSRAASTLPYSPESPVDLIPKSNKHLRNVPGLSGAALAEVDRVPNPLSTGRNTDNELEDDCISFSSADQKTEATSVQQEANNDGEDGKLEEEEVWPLSPDESSPNSASENGYESTSERSILNYSQKDLISRLMDEICSSFFFQVCHRPQQLGRRAADSFSSGSTQISINTIDFNNNDSSASRRKRARKDDEDPEDEDNRKRKRQRSNESVSSDSPLAEVRYFACPFHKFDVSTYSNRNENPRLALKFRSCGPPGWPTIGKMKEHLYRSHQTPIHCPRCWTVMKTEAALGEHARASIQCNIVPQPLRWIPREVYQKLKDRKKAFAGQTDEDTWRYIFGLIFPDSAIIPSPYYDEEVVPEDKAGSDSPTAQAIAAYEEYARAHLPRLVEEALETSVAEQTQPIEESLRRALAGIVRDCHTRLAQNFLQHRSSKLGDTGIQIEALPSFYIEPLNLTDENSFLDLDYVTAHEQLAPGPQTDSGYASVNQSFERDSRELLGDRTLQDGLGSFYGANYNGTNIYSGNQTTLEDYDWAAILGNGNDNYFGK